MFCSCTATVDESYLMVNCSLVTGLNKWIAVFSVGIVCTFYTTIVSVFDTLAISINVHGVSKNIPDVFSYNSRKHCQIFIINASALLCETENMEIVSFHVNVSC